MLDRASEGAPQIDPNTGGRRRGRKSPPSLGWMAEAAPPTNTEAHRVGEGRRHKEAFLLQESSRGLGVFGGGEANGNTVAQAPHPSHNPGEGAESTGPDWKQMGPPCQARDTRSGGGGEDRAAGWGRRGGPTQAANPGRRCCPGVGLKTPRERPGIRRPGRSWELGEVVREGKEA